VLAASALLLQTGKQELTSCETAVDAPGVLTGMLQLNCCPAAFVMRVLRVCAASGSNKAVSSAAAAAAAAAAADKRAI
jgi:hypothetical protein